MFQCPLCEAAYGDPRSAEECARIDEAEDREARRATTERPH